MKQQRVLSWMGVLLLCAVCQAQTPDEVLQGKGLRKFGSFYALEADANLATTSRAWKGAQYQYEEGMKRRTVLERDIRSARATLEDLANQNEIETRRLEQTPKSGYASYNRQVGVVNGIRGKMREAIKVVETRQKALEGVDDPGEAYGVALQKASQVMDVTMASYKKLADDAEVAAAIDAVNKTAKPAMKLGPSDAFKAEATRVNNLKKIHVSSTINFEMAGGVPHVPITLNGEVKTFAVLDSGASVLLLTFEDAKKIGLDKPQDGERTSKFVTADGTVIEGRVVNVKSVQLGSFVVENVEAGILPQGMKGAANLLGGSFLRHFVYKMDLAGGFIRLSQIPDARANAKPADTEGEKKPAGVAAGQTNVDEIVVEALIDGLSELHIAPDGIYWKSLGVSKPGLHGGKDEPTYINGEAWRPVWRKPGERGIDQSGVLKLPIGNRVYDMEIVAVSKERGDSNKELRDQVTLKYEAKEQVISIPDRQVDSMWYTIRLTRRAEKK